jgi:hypothetical protein
MSSEHQHVEVVVVLRPDADADAVTESLARHGVRVVAPIKAGLLAAGEAAAVMAAFGAERLDALSIPDALREHVASVAVVPPKALHDGGD